MRTETVRSRPGEGRQSVAGKMWDPFFWMQESPDPALEPPICTYSKKRLRSWTGKLTWLGGRRSWQKHPSSHGAYTYLHTQLWWTNVCGFRRLYWNMVQKRGGKGGVRLALFFFVPSCRPSSAPVLHNRETDLWTTCSFIHSIQFNSLDNVYTTCSSPGSNNASAILRVLLSFLISSFFHPIGCAVADRGEGGFFPDARSKRLRL